MYFDYPLEQGLRQNNAKIPDTPAMYFDYPLEQGLRHTVSVTCMGTSVF